MSEEQAGYVTQEDIDDANAMLGAGYEIHPPAKVLEMQADYSLKQSKSKAWVKIDVGFRDAMKKLKGSQLSVFLAISLRINENFESYPSIETIAKDTGYSERAVKSATKKLDRAGFLTIVRGEKLSNLYHVNAFAAYGESNPNGAKIAPSANNDTEGGNNELNAMSEIAPKEEPINKNHKDKLSKEKKPTANDILFGYNEKIHEQNAMIEEVHRIIGYEPNMGGNGKWERTVRKLIKLKKQGIDLETFWTWNMSEERKYERLTKIKLLQSPGLLTDMMEAESGVFQHKRQEPKDGRGEYV